MKIKIIAIGKLSNKSPEKNIIDQYLKRLSNKIEIKEFDYKNSNSPYIVKLKEGEMLLSESESYYNIVLDEHGIQLNSVEFANMIEKFKLENRNKIAFIIGGAFGLCNEIKQIADLKLSLGKMTIPHMIARIIIIEQIYRAFSIISNHPYHK